MVQDNVVPGVDESEGVSSVSRPRDVTLEERDPAAVLTSIEAIITGLLEQLAQGVLPDFEVVRRQQTQHLDPVEDPTA